MLIAVGGVASVSAGLISNLTASRAPTASDGADQGYSIGSYWMAPGMACLWGCSNATPGAAVWFMINGTNGKSAYDLAVTGGYVGDVTAWVASLRGAVGVSVVGATINASGRLILTLSTGSLIDAGVVKPSLTVEDIGGLSLALGAKVDSTDPRLTDARTPTTHTHPTSAITGLPAALATIPRVLKLAGTLGAGGASTVTFSPGFSTTPTVIEGTAWSGSQAVHSYVTAVSTTGATIKGKRSKGTLLLTAGPFEDAAAGDPYSIVFIGA